MRSSERVAEACYRVALPCSEQSHREARLLPASAGFRAVAIRAREREFGQPGKNRDTFEGAVDMPTAELISFR